MAHFAEAHSLEESLGNVEGVDLVGFVHHGRLCLSLGHVRFAMRVASMGNGWTGACGEQQKCRGTDGRWRRNRGPSKRALNGSAGCRVKGSGNGGLID